MKQIFALLVGFVVWLAILFVIDSLMMLTMSMSRTAVAPMALTATIGSIGGTIYAAAAAGKVAPQMSARVFHIALFSIAFLIFAPIAFFGRDPSEGWARPLVFLFCSTLPILQGLRSSKNKILKGA